MHIVGCDFHPSWQQVDVLDSETNKIEEGKLDNGRQSGGCYRQLPSLPFAISTQQGRLLRSRLRKLTNAAYQKVSRM